MKPTADPASKQRGPKSSRRVIDPLIQDDIGDLIRALADTPTSAETFGVARDDMADELIGLARQWVKREDKK
jgi:hypothetical protein